MLDAQAIQARQWEQHPFDPARFAGVRTMLTQNELRMLNWLSHEAGDLGCVFDGGAFLGGSTVQLADGLLKHPDPLKKVHSFDLFTVPGHARGRFGLAADAESTLSVYAQNITPWAERIVVYPGDIMYAAWPPQPIEILFVDCLKSAALNSWLVRHVLPHVLPGSVLIQQDFLFPALPWIHVTMGYFAEHFKCFKYLADTEINSVIYLCERPPTTEEVGGFEYRSFSERERFELFDLATERFTTDRQRECIAGARKKI